MAVSGVILVLLLGGAGAISSLPAAHAFSPIGIEKPQPTPSDPDARRPTVCTERYVPVCGRLNKMVKTFPNECYARAAGAGIIAQGPCNGQSGPRDAQ